MEYWYVQHGDKWGFCYKLDKEEQEIIDSIIPEAIRHLRERVVEQIGEIITR